MKTLGKISFVIGGSGSGKSRFAEDLVSEQRCEVAYVATCRTDCLHADPEMQQRIQKHRQQRPSEWVTYENQMDLSVIANECEGKTVLLDCLTLWLSDAMQGEADEQGKILTRLQRGLDAFVAANIHLVVVSNEVGAGIVPIGQGMRTYRDLVGKGNQLVAAASRDVYWIVAGIPVRIKKDGVQCDLNTAEK